MCGRNELLAKSETSTLATMIMPKKRNLTIDEHNPVSYAMLRGKSYADWVEARSKIMHRYSGKMDHDSTGACILCGPTEFEKLFDKEGYHFVECEKCGLVQVNPLPTSSVADDFYNAPEYVEFTRKHMTEKADYRKERFGRERVEMWNEYLGTNSGDAPRKSLDVGCGSGFVLDAAEEMGWEAYGLDLNESAIKEANSRGLKAFAEKLETITASRFGLFDVVTMYDVLEHSYDPRAMVSSATQLLKPDGLMVIYVPNWNSMARHVLGVDTFWIWGIFHLTYFTLDTLSRLTNECGLRIIEYDTQGLDWADIIWRNENIEKSNVSFLQENLELLQFSANAAGLGAGLRLYLRKEP